MDGLIRFLFLGQLLAKAWRNAMMFARLLWQAFVALLKALGTAFLAFWSHVPALCSIFADSWLDKATDAGFPTIWDRQLYYILWALAFLVTGLAWIACSYITVWLVHILRIVL